MRYKWAQNLVGICDGETDDDGFDCGIGGAEVCGRGGGEGGREASVQSRLK
jgi:hypothetical protein